MRKLGCLVGVASLWAACSKAKAPAPAPAAGSGSSQVATPPAPASSGWYRVVLGEKQGTAIPFFLQIPATGDDAFIATGPDRVRAKLVSRPPELVVQFDILHTEIAATAGEHGALDGTWASTSKSWGTASLSLHAEPVAGPDPALRFASSPGGPDPSGVWKVQLTKPDEWAKLVVTHGAGTELTGTLAFQTGNLAFLAGNQDGSTIRLSAFDGSSPYLLTAELDAAGKTFKGAWTAGQALDWKETLTGTKTPDFVLEHPLQLVARRPMLKLPELAKPPYKGQPVIVELGGSWCPACGHATTKLKELAARYGSQGLQVLTLAYEFTDDAGYNKRQAELFKTKFQLPWQVIPVDGGLEKYNDILPPELESIDASGFPITIFVARDGGIEGFHSGFPAEKWGPLHDQVVADYDRLTAKILSTGKEHTR